MSKFIIFSHPRSGSTSLARVLGEIDGVRMCIEPFHPNFSNWNPGEKNYHQLITDTKSMDKALIEIFEKYTAIKVLSYLFSKKIYFSMLGNKDYKILFLRRNNLLDALSNLIAEQTSEWHKSKSLKKYNQLKQIPISKIESWIKYVNDTNNTYFNFLEKNRKGEYLPLYYEKLFSDNMDLNINILQSVCDYLSFPLPKVESIKKHMSPTNSKININNLYSKLPNYNEIKSHFQK